MLQSRLSKAAHLIAFAVLSCGIDGWGLPLFVAQKSNFQEMSSSSEPYDGPCAEPPYLAIITERDACNTHEHVEATFEAISKAVETGKVDVVSIRLSRPTNDKELFDVHNRALDLTKRLVQLAENTESEPPTGTPNFWVVCSSDWVDLALEANAHGVHVKEAHISKIPNIRQAAIRSNFVIGTSTHSVSSAIDSYRVHRPDYYFAGTCFRTPSHPEKTEEELEGPTFPGEVRQALQHEITKSGREDTCPVVFGIGGLDETNCDIPVSHGVDGVAVIRAVLQSPNPAETTAAIYSNMKFAISDRRKELPCQD